MGKSSKGGWTCTWVCSALSFLLVCDSEESPPSLLKLVKSPSYSFDLGPPQGKIISEHG